MSSLFPLWFPVFLNSPISKFPFYFPIPVFRPGIFTRSFSALFPFLKPILFSFSFFLISRFSFKYKGFKDFSFLLFKILSLSKAGWNLMKSGKKKRKLVKKKSKKDFRPSRSSFHFPYFNRTQALCVAVCFWSEDWVGFGGMGTIICSSPIQTTHPVPSKTNILQN